MMMMCPSCADVFCFAGGALIITASAALPFSLSGGVLWRLYHYHYHAYAYAHAHAHIHILLWFLWHAPQKHSKKKGHVWWESPPQKQPANKQTLTPLLSFFSASLLLCCAFACCWSASYCPLLCETASNRTFIGVLWETHHIITVVWRIILSVAPNHRLFLFLL